MEKVICIDDKNLFPGAEVVEGIEYEVLDDFINNWGEKVYIIKGIKNEGITSKGLRWFGYRANRFASSKSKTNKKEEFNYALN